jgi:hypothetical protein
MTYTIVTEDGTVMFREDIFATKAEADEYLALEPLTPSGKPQFAVSTEAAAIIVAEIKSMRERYERRLQIERIELVGRVLKNAEVVGR